MIQNRRKFLNTALAHSTILLLPRMEGFAIKQKPEISAMKDNGLKIMQTNWGFDGSMDAFCAKAKQVGYDGVELWWPEEKKDQDSMFAALEKYNLEIGLICGVSESDPALHLTSYKKMIDAAAKQKIKKPLYINNHSGRDYFDLETNGNLIEHTISLAKETGIEICHETHRGRMLYAAPVAKQLMHKFPELKLTLDISHWCTVHESMLEDQSEAVQMALERSQHIHAQIGHPEGPQVNDPRAPEWEKIVEQHFKWWDKIVERKKKSRQTVTFLTEFGPPNYMPTMPYTQKPLVDQWEINVYMMEILRKRYAG